MDYRGLWQAVLGELEVKVSRANFSTWLKQTTVISNEDGHVVVGVPNIFTKGYIEKNYHADIKATLVKVNAQVKSVEYKVAAAIGGFAADLRPGVTQVGPTAPTSPEALGPAQSEVPSTSLNPKYTFDTFVVGSSNELAYAAAQAVAKHSGTKYNPLFIYGGVGLGKTHLIQAIGNEIRRRDPGKHIEYITSEGFTNEFISSIGRKKTDSFTRRYRSADVLIIDDMQFLAGKEKTQDEFFHTFNTLHQANKQIIISSDKPPKAIPTIEDRLRSRFGWGMTADIQAPDLETRSAIIQTKAAAQGVLMPPEVVEYLAKNIQNNVRELEGALTQLLAHCEFKDAPPSIAAATGLIGHLAARRSHLKPLTARAIIEKTAAYYDLQTADILGARRDKEIVVPRQVAMYLMRHEINLSFPKIASVCGGRDHTTAMHSVTKIDKLLEFDENMRQEVNLIKERLYI
jgi:chromosomal replication initiator protein